MDNSKVLKPIIGPQESTETKKKEKNKKKKALIVSALAFLIATGTIWASIAVVKANMPKLEIKFDDWFVDSFDFDSMQNFIDENRLSKGDIDKKLPGYVDKKAKDQNVKNADMITNAKLTNKIPEDKNNKLPHGIYVEMTAELDYAFVYQADLSLEDNPDQETRELSSIADEPKKLRYYINKDRSKLYVLVYERDSDSDESLPEDLQTFNDFKISNCPEAFRKLNDYIAEQSRRYTAQEFEQTDNWKPGLEIFRNALIGLEANYVKDVAFDYDTDNNTPGGTNQKVMKIFLDNVRSNFEFIDAAQTNGAVSYSEETGTLTIKDLEYFQEDILNLDNLQEQIQEYIKAYDEADDEGRYTFSEFQTKMNDPKLLELIAKSLGIEKEIVPPPTEPETPENPDEGENGVNPFADPETTPPAINTSRIKNLIPVSGTQNLIIELKCDEKHKYGIPKNYDTSLYSFNQVADQLTVKNLKYYTEHTLTGTSNVFNAIDKLIVETRNQYTEEEFKARVEGKGTQAIIKELIARNLKTNGQSFNIDLIKNITYANNQLDIELDTDLNKYVLGKNESKPSVTLNEQDSILSIRFTQFFEQVQLNDLAKDIQKFSDDGSKYTIEEFTDQITNSGSDLETEIKKLVKESIDAQIGITDFEYNVRDFNYDVLNNHLSFRVTIPKYKKFPLQGQNITCELISKNPNDTVDYTVTISNLEYWFDFEIEDNTLLETKKNVEDYILRNAVSSTDDEEDNTYPQHKEKIYKIFGDTRLKNGMKLAEFMTLSDNDFKLEKHKDFLINLKPKLDKETKLRAFYPVDNLTSDGIELKEPERVLKFNNLEFSIGDKFFVLDRKHKIIYGVSALGRNSTTLSTPKGYKEINFYYGWITKEDNTRELSYGFENLKNLEVFNMNNDVTTIKPKEGYSPWFLYNFQNLTTLNLSENITVFPNKSCSYLTKLKEFNFKKGFSKISILPEYFFQNTALSNILLPKNVKTVSQGSFQASYNWQTFDYFITWAEEFNGPNIFYKYRGTQNIYLLSDNVEFNGNPFDDFKNNRNAKFYVKNKQVKQKLLDKYWEFDKQVFVNENLEQELKNAGKIPQDW